ncbi:MAG TPA: hypothetical protein VEY51_11395 [Chondromyces sp.]|nr:hypothetical protein [Chondromyces sp.]
MNNDKPTTSPDRNNKDMDGGPIGGRLNSDNSFSDKGLENARLLRKAMDKGQSK